MNPLNYASIEASKRLDDAEIVLETEAVWVWPEYKASGIYSTNPDNVMPYLSPRCCREVENGGKFLPAPSMAEVWRELPNKIHMRKLAGQTWCWNGIAKDDFSSHNINPVDALIDLLIHIKGLDMHK